MLELFNHGNGFDLHEFGGLGGVGQGGDWGWGERDRESVLQLTLAVEFHAVDLSYTAEALPVVVVRSAYTDAFRGVDLC